MVDLRLDFFPLAVGQGSDVDFVVEVADVADDGLVLHGVHVFARDHMVVAGGGDKDVAVGGGFFHRHDLEAFHGGLQGADRVDFGDPHLRAQRDQRLGAALAHVAVTGHNRDLAGDHDVGGALDAVNQRFAAAVQVVELGLGDRVVDVDGGKRQLALLRHLVQAMHAGGGFFGHALDQRQAGRVPLRIALERFLDGGKQDALFVAARVGQDGEVLFGLGAQVQHQRGVAAIVQDHVGVLAVGPFKDLVRVLPVLFQRLALDGEDRRAGRGDGGGGVVLRGEDVARGPAHFSAQRHQRFDQHAGLDGHVQAAGDARALERLRRGEFLADGHQAGHFGFGDGEFAAAPAGQRHVGDEVVGKGFISHSVHGV